MILSTGSHHAYPAPEPQVVDDLGEEGRSAEQGPQKVAFQSGPSTAEQRLQQGDLQVGPQHGDRDPGEAGPTPNVDYRGARVNQLRQRRTVQDVSLPQPAELARTDQPPIHPIRSKNVDISINHHIAGAVELLGWAGHHSSELITCLTRV